MTERRLPAVIPPASKVNRTLAGLRESLFDSLDQLRAGQIDAKDAKAHAELAGQILDAARLQLDFEKAFAEKRIGDKLREVKLVEHQQN